ncbi:MAG: YdcF family protein [Flavobacteriales bacterium]|nr:YdcF family protein [Flavobacteriales bacterium]
MTRWSDLFPTLGMVLRPALVPLLWLGRGAVIVIGSSALILIVLAFTSIPFQAHRWLGMGGGVCTGPVDAIVVLGGSGMPSGPELLRLHYGSELARDLPQAKVFLVHAEDTVTAALMVDELVMRGVDRERIELQLQGSNTREQAMAMAMDHSAWGGRTMALVTAPENMYRTLGAFRKVGFSGACGVPAFDQALFVDLEYSFKKIGGSRLVPDVSDDLDLRYTFWNYLKLEVTCLREYAAIAYYRLNGWM